MKKSDFGIAFTRIDSLGLIVMLTLFISTTQLKSNDSEVTERLPAADKDLDHAFAHWARP